MAILLKIIFFQYPLNDHKQEHHFKKNFRMLNHFQKKICFTTVIKQSRKTLEYNSIHLWIVSPRIKLLSDEYVVSLVYKKQECIYCKGRNTFEKVESKLFDCFFQLLESKGSLSQSLRPLTGIAVSLQSQGKEVEQQAVL